LHHKTPAHLLADRQPVLMAREIKLRVSLVQTGHGLVDAGFYVETLPDSVLRAALSARRSQPTGNR